MIEEIPSPRELDLPLDKNDEVDEEVPEGGWGWIVVVSAFVFNVITDGCSYSFGVLFTYLVDYFETTRSKTAWIGSLFNSAPLLFGPIASYVTNRYGFRKTALTGGIITFIGFFASVFAPSVEAMCVTYGIVAGFGVSLPYLVSCVIVADYFKRRLSLASGLAECGAGVGTLVFAPLLESLIASYGWRGALLIVSGIMGNIIVCGAVYTPVKKKKKTKKSNSKELHNLTLPDSEISIVSGGSDLDHKSANGSAVLGKELENTTSSSARRTRNETSLRKCMQNTCCNSKFIDLKVLLNWKYALFALSNFTLYFWYDVPYVFTVDRAVEFGETEYHASLLVSVMGILHTVGNILCGYIGDRQCINRSCFYSVALWICGGALALVPISRELVPTGVLVGTYGLLSAATEALKIAVLTDIVGTDRLTNAYGTLMFLQGIANLVGPPFAGMNQYARCSRIMFAPV